MSPPHVQLVVFDLGGTTVQLTVDVVQAFQDAFRKFNVSISKAAIDSYRGASKREAIAQLARDIAIRDVDEASIYHEFQQLLLKGLADNGVEPVPNVEDAFLALQSAGIRVVLTTGFDSMVTTRLLDGLDWAKRIDGIVTADDVAAGRPAPDMILRAMRLVGMEVKGRVVVVGDTANDIKAGRAAGIGSTVGVLSGAHDRTRLAAAGPTTILETAADVPEWLGLRLGEAE